MHGAMQVETAKVPSAEMNIEQSECFLEAPNGHVRPGYEWTGRTHRWKQ